MDFTPFAYMRWAKETFHRARFDLGSSGIRGPDATEVGFTDWEPSSCTGGGDVDLGRLTAAIADRMGVASERVYPTPGASYGMFLTVAAMVSPGDEVLVETPAYEALTRVAEAVGARVRRFERRFDEAYRIPEDRIAGLVSPRTRAVILTNLHNPTGARVTHGEMRRLIEVTSEAAPLVIANEVYRDYLMDEKEPPLAAVSDRVVSLFSLTKVYGLGRLRAGWIVGTPPLLRRLTDFNDLILVNMPAPVVDLMLRALAAMDRIAARVRDHVAVARPLVESFLKARGDLEWVPPAGGIFGFPRVTRPGFGAMAFARRLLEEEGVLVVPGDFFGDPSCFRLGFGAPVEALTPGLDRLGRALDRYDCG